MQLFETLKLLYSRDISSICKVLNESVYITDLQNTEHYLLHTGFSFLTHKEKKMLVYYQLETDIIVRCPDSTNPLYGKFPQLLGLLCRTEKGGYIKDFVLNFLSIELDITNKETLFGNEIAKPTDLEILQNKIDLKDKNDVVYTHSEFFIVKEHETLLKLPLFTEYERPIFYDMSTFSEYTPWKYQKYSSNEKDEDWCEDYQGCDYWSCDACDGNSETGCLSSTGNCYR